MHLLSWLSVDEILPPSDKLPTIWKPDLSDHVKQDFSEEIVVSVLLQGCTPFKMPVEKA